MSENSKNQSVRILASTSAQQAGVTPMLLANAAFCIEHWNDVPEAKRKSIVDKLLAASAALDAWAEPRALAKSVAELRALEGSDDRGLTPSEGESIGLVLRELARWQSLGASPAALTDVRADGFRDCIDAIKGAIAFGQRDTNHPPEGHWLAEFWGIGRKLAASPADQEEDARVAPMVDSLRLIYCLAEGGTTGNIRKAIAKEARAAIDAAMSASKEGAQ